MIIKYHLLKYFTKKWKARKDIKKRILNPKSSTLRRVKNKKKKRKHTKRKLP
jgi:hypothetical protein